MAEHLEKTEQNKRKKRKHDALGIVLRVLLVIAAVLFCVLMVLAWPSIREKGFHDTFFGSNDEGEMIRADEIDFVANQKNAFAAYRNGLAILSPSGLTVLASDGNATLDTSKSFANPVICVSGDRLLAYDAGGTNMLYIEKDKVVSDKPASNSVISASVNAKGWRLVITEHPSWKAIATVLRPGGEQAYELQSAERYIVGGDVSPDSTRFALGGVRQSDAEIISSVYIYELSSTEPIAFWESTVGVPMTVKFLDDSRILAICENIAVFVDGDTGEELGRYAFGSQGLDGCAVGNDFVAFATGGTGGSSWVTTLSYTGDQLARQGMSSVIDLSANGDTLGVLTSDSVLVYNKYLEVAADGDAPAGGRRILVCGDSSAYVLSANEATLIEY